MILIGIVVGFSPLLAINTAGRAGEVENPDQSRLPLRNYYKDYPLFMYKGRIGPRLIPILGVRIDDLNCAKVAEVYTSKELVEKFYQSSTATVCILHTQRYPLGDAAKV